MGPHDGPCFAPRDRKYGPLFSKWSRMVLSWGNKGIRMRGPYHRAAEDLWMFWKVMELHALSSIHAFGARLSAKAHEPMYSLGLLTCGTAGWF